MKSRQTLNTSLSRRSLLVLTGATLTGCGGGDALTAAGPPGTGGTGVFAQGAISGFGSVIVNGIKFDDTKASIQLDGVSVASTVLRLGMMAVVEGQRGANLMLGTAATIEVWSTAQGPVSQIAGNAFKLAGMTIETNSNTVFDGIASVAALAPGARVTVWGLQAGSDGQHWTATRVAMASDATVVSTGLISSLNSRTYLNGLRLTGSMAGNLNTGDMLRVQGVLSVAGDSLAVDSSRVMGPGLLFQPEGDVEIEGLVTAVSSASRFMMGRFDVDASAATYSPPAPQILVGLRLKVIGTWRLGVLRASSIDVEDEISLQSVEIMGVIEKFVSLGNFVVRGQRCDATSAAITRGTAADFQNGKMIAVKGIKAGDVLRVTDLKLITG
jgi:hypothetical protein